MALTLLLRHATLAQLEIPKIALWPLGLGALVLVQWVTGQVAFPVRR